MRHRFQEPLGADWTLGAPGNTGGVTNCNPDSSFTQLGSRTMWNPVPDLDVGFDVGWVHMNTAFAGFANLNNLGTVFQPNAAGRPAGYTGTWLLAGGDWRRLPAKYSSNSQT